MKLNPLGNKLLLIEYEEEQKQGSLILMESSKPKKELYEVVNHGPDIKHIEVGDIVLLERYAAQAIEFDDEKYFIASEDKVIGWLKED